jgi:hypothetical protein
MKKLIILFMLISLNLLSLPKCPDEKNPIYCRILELKPNVKKSWAFEFSNILSKYTKKNKLDPMRALAIAMQESSLNEVHRKQTVVTHDYKCSQTKEGSEECTPEIKLVKGFTDLTLFQFHIGTINHFKLDLLRLVEHDLEYAVESYCKIMKSKKKTCAKMGEDAWVCYHSKSKNLQEIYKTQVDRYYPQEAGQ